MTQRFFCNTGLEANEAPSRSRASSAWTRGWRSPVIVVYDHAFHGRSIATMTATANPRCRNGSARCWTASSAWRPTTSEALQEANEGNANIVAVLMEPIQGEGGLHPMRGLPAAGAQLCDANGWLLDARRGAGRHGRTGKWFAHQWAGIVPDVMTLGKGLGSACRWARWWRMARRPRCSSPATMAPPSAATRSPCAPAWETIRIMEEDRLLDNATAVART